METMDDSLRADRSNTTRTHRGNKSPQSLSASVSRIDLCQVRAICEVAMREYGVPARIRTDNGAPFAGTGLLRLSELSLGWMNWDCAWDDTSGQTATKRSPRADASHAERRHDEPTCGIPSSTTESLRSFSSRVQR